MSRERSQKKTFSPAETKWKTPSGAVQDEAGESNAHGPEWLRLFREFDPREVGNLPEIHFLLRGALYDPEDLLPV